MQTQNVRAKDLRVGDVVIEWPRHLTNAPAAGRTVRATMTTNPTVHTPGRLVDVIVQLNDTGVFEVCPVIGAYAKIRITAR